MSRTIRNIPFKLPSFALDYEYGILIRDGFSSNISPDKNHKKQHNKLLRTRQKEKLAKGEEFLLNKRSHIWHWW